VELQFANTYHLMVHPGPDIVETAGGLHVFMGRKRGPIITDSGGFQVFSLGHESSEDTPELKRRSATRGRNVGTLLSVSERGVKFRSYLDGSTLELTPESSVLAQKALGADIIIPLDELPPIGVSRERLARSVDLSHRWMARSLRTHLDDRRQQAMYAIIHGGTDRELRAHSVDVLSALPFDGYAVGGSLGKDREEVRGVRAGRFAARPGPNPGCASHARDETKIPPSYEGFPTSHALRPAPISPCAVCCRNAMPCFPGALPHTANPSSALSQSVWNAVVQPAGIRAAAATRGQAESHPGHRRPGVGATERAAWG
jgi:queuine tRNA-ribosyltransferase